MTRQRRDRSGDEGASLMLVLLFVVIVGGVLAGLIPYMQTGISEAATARDVRTLQSAVDGAVQGAIGQARLDTDACAGKFRPVYTAPSYPDPVDPSKSVNVTVTCAPSGTGNVNADIPPYAILTTNGPLLVSGNETLAIAGGVYTNGPIKTTSGAGSALKVVVSGPVYTTAGNTCDAGLVTSSAFLPTGVPHCPAQSGDPDLPDTSSSQYPSSLGTSVPTPTDPLGTCSSANSIVTFVPGYYSEPPQVDPVSCKNNNSNIWWFSPCASAAGGGGCPSGTAPGVYYFDFPDSAYDHYTNAQAQWDLNDSKINLLGGSLQNGWDATTSYNTVANRAAGSRCDPTGTGVQLVEGGATQIETGNSSSIELCASKTAPGSSVTGSDQRIALYGVASDYPSAVAGPRQATTNPPGPASTVADVNGDTSYTTSAGAEQHGGTVARGDFTGKAATYGLKLSNYSTPANGSLIPHAWLEVTHAETNVKIVPTITVTYPSGSGTVTDICVLPSSGSGTLRTDEVDLLNMSNSDCTKSGPDTDLAAGPLRYRMLQKMTVTYEATAPKSVGSTGNPESSFLDGVELKTQSVAPAIEAQRPAQGQPAANYFAFTNSDTFNPADDNAFFIGTIYEPQAPVWATVHNSPVTMFRRGVIAQTLTVDENASSKQSDPPFQLPSTSSSRVVLFTATVNGKARLRALVRFIDYSPPDPSTSDNSLYFPGRAVVVKEWTSLN